MSGGLTRGMPTSYAAEPLCRLIQAGNDPIPVLGRPARYDYTASHLEPVWKLD